MLRAKAMDAESQVASKRPIQDVLGIQGFAKATEILAQGAVDGTGAFLSRICLPAAEEFGLLLRDKVSEWRKRNLEKILNRAEKKLAEDSTENVHCHPRILASVVENGAWTDDELLQEMWSGLLVSSCNEDGTDDGASLFVRLLANCTPTQARIVDAVCRRIEVAVAPNGLLISNVLVEFDFEAFTQVTGINDILQIDRELDNLRDLGLLPPIGSGFNPFQSDLVASLEPTSICLHFYAAAHGKGMAIKEFYEATNQIVPFTKFIGKPATIRFQ
jgi:hypothetical protein